MAAMQQNRPYHTRRPVQHRTAPRRRRQPVDLYNVRRRDNRSWLARHWAACILVAVIFAGMFSQIYAISRLTHTQKQIAQANATIIDLKSQTDNLNVKLNTLKRTINLEERAMELGMVKPEGDAIRTVPVQFMAKNSDTNAQTAMSGQNP